MARQDNVYRELDEQVKNLVFDCIIDQPKNCGEIKAFIRLVELLNEPDPLKRDHIAFVATRYAFKYAPEFDKAFNKFVESEDEAKEINDQNN
jgi:hypothetical protein